MFISLCQHQRRPSLPKGLDHVLVDKPIALFISNQFRIEFLELLPYIGICRSQRTKVSRTNHDSMIKRVSCCLLADALIPTQRRAVYCLKV